MTAVDDRPQTVLRHEEVAAETDLHAPQVAPAPPRTGSRTAGRVMITIGLLTAWTFGYLTVLSGYPEARAQKNLYAQLRADFAGYTAPTSEPVAAGTPIALVDAPAAGIHHLVVVEGTSPEQLQDGPGHLRSTSLPGQAGISVLMGRSLTYGAPFGGVHDLRPGDVITVATGQGRFHYRVIDRRVGGGVTSVPDSTTALLTLVTSSGTGFLSGLTASSTLYVDAVIVGNPQPRSGTSPSVSSSELPLHDDHSFSTLATLTLLLQLLIVALAGVAWARSRWSSQLAYVIGVPIILAALWLVTDVGARLLPNVM